MDQVKNKIQDFRKRKKINQSEIAKHLGISQAAYAKIESGKTNISLDKLFLIADFLGVTIGDLITDSSLTNVSTSSEKSQKFLVFHALETYESTEAFFAGGIFNSQDPEDEKKFDEYRVNLRKFKNGMYKNLVLVGFCTHDEITEYKNSINPNKK
jgi:putative transcriptional regulator